MISSKRAKRSLKLKETASIATASMAGACPALIALNGDPWVIGEPGPVIATVLNGRKGQLGQMPTWKDKIDDNQIAAVVTYIRQAWSNKAPAVTPALVAEIRRKAK